jgi:hypothetical protein
VIIERSLRFVGVRSENDKPQREARRWLTLGFQFVGLQAAKPTEYRAARVIEHAARRNDAFAA